MCFSSQPPDVGTRGSSSEQVWDVYSCILIGSTRVAVELGLFDTGGVNLMVGYRATLLV